MHDDRERTLELVSTRTGFEAEAIAAALRERGINAQTIDSQNAELWGGSMGTAKVVVLERDALAARAALEDIRSDARRIDWEAVDVGEGPSTLTARRRHHRAALTLAFLLLPVGFIIISHGTLRHNPMVQLIGGTLMTLSIAIALIVYNARQRERGEAGRGRNVQDGTGDDSPT